MNHKEPQRNLQYVSTNGILLLGGKVLLSRRKNTDWADGMLVLPGGHVETGETPRQAIVRELLEEVGLRIRMDELKFCCVAQRNSGGRQYVAYEFIVTLSSEQQPVNGEPDRCAELVWSDPASLPDDVVTDFRHIITDGFIGKQAYMELGY